MGFICADDGACTGICDVDDQRACEAYEKNPEVPRFRDFRVMLDKMAGEIDAVVREARARAPSFLLALLALGIAPGFGEEILFRFFDSQQDLLALGRRFENGCHPPSDDRESCASN